MYYTATDISLYVNNKYNCQLLATDINTLLIDLGYLTKVNDGHEITPLGIKEVGGFTHDKLDMKNPYRSFKYVAWKPEILDVFEQLIGDLKKKNLKQRVLAVFDRLENL